MRILISYEDSYLLYNDTLERALGDLRPEAEVAACRLRVLGEQVKSFNPLSSCRVAKTAWIREGGRLGTGSLPSPTNRPRPVSAGGAGRG